MSAPMCCSVVLAMHAALTGLLLFGWQTYFLLVCIRVLHHNLPRHAELFIFGCSKVDLFVVVTTRHSINSSGRPGYGRGVRRTMDKASWLETARTITLMRSVEQIVAGIESAHKNSHKQVEKYLVLI